MQNTYQEKIDDLEVTNSGEKRKLEGGIKFKIKSKFQPNGFKFNNYIVIYLLKVNMNVF